MFLGGVSLAALAASLVPAWVSPGAISDNNFVTGQSYGPKIQVSRSTEKYVPNKNGDYIYFAPDTLPATDQGFLPEGAQTNQVRNSAGIGVVLGQSQNAIRNNSMQGAVAGTPGTPPTNWAMSTGVGGVSRTIVGSGSVPGVDYVDVRVFGTPTSSGFYNIAFEGGSIVAATNGQLWTNSVFVALIAGSLTNTQSLLEVRENNSSGGFLTNLTTGFVPNATLTRFPITKTLSNASTAFVQPYVDLQLTSGQPIDVTLRIGSPQLEQAPSAGPVTRTTNAAANYSAGIMPNNWGLTAGANGVFRQITASTVENGVEVIELRFFGVATATTGLFIGTETNTGISAVTGDLVSCSYFFKLQSGTQNGISNPNIRIISRDSTGAAINTVGSAITIPTTLQRPVFTSSLGTANTAYVTSDINLTIANGATVDFTLRVGWPQVEKWASNVSTVGGASTPIRTTNGARTRAADSITAVNPVGANIPISVAGVFRTPPISLAYGASIVRAGTGGSTGYRVIKNTGLGNLSGGETGQPSVSVSGSLTADTRYAFAFGGDTVDQQGAVNGVLAPSAGPALTVGHNGMVGYGCNSDGTAQTYGFIERIAIFPFRHSNDNLQRLSTLAAWGG